jgi:hypothetical protein
MKQVKKANDFGRKIGKMRNKSAVTCVPRFTSLNSSNTLQFSPKVEINVPKNPLSLINYSHIFEEEKLD